MSAFNFPTTPSNGQEFAPPGGPVYIWNGYAWDCKPAERVEYDTLAARVVVLETDMPTKATTGTDATFNNIRSNAAITAAGDITAFS